jgi:hypothetical protein
MPCWLFADLGNACPFLNSGHGPDAARWYFLAAAHSFLGAAFSQRRVAAGSAALAGAYQKLRTKPSSRRLDRYQQNPSRTITTDEDTLAFGELDSNRDNSWIRLVRHGDAANNHKIDGETDQRGHGTDVFPDLKHLRSIVWPTIHF